MYCVNYSWLLTLRRHITQNIMYTTNLTADVIWLYLHLLPCDSVKLTNLQYIHQFSRLREFKDLHLFIKIVHIILYRHIIDVHLPGTKSVSWYYTAIDIQWRPSGFSPPNVHSLNSAKSQTHLCAWDKGQAERNDTDWHLKTDGRQWEKRVTRGGNAKAERSDKEDWKLVVWEHFANMTSIRTPQKPPPAF